MSSILICLEQKSVSTKVLFDLKRVLEVSLIVLKNQIECQSLICKFDLFNNDYEEVEKKLLIVTDILESNGVSYVIFELQVDNNDEVCKYPITIHALKNILENFKENRKDYDV